MQVMSIMSLTLVIQSRDAISWHIISAIRYLRPILGLNLLSDLFWIWFNIFANRASASFLSTLLLLDPDELRKKRLTYVLLSTHKATTNQLIGVEF